MDRQALQSGHLVDVVVLPSLLDRATDVVWLYEDDRRHVAITGLMNGVKWVSDASKCGQVFPGPPNPQANKVCDKCRVEYLAQRQLRDWAGGN